jgi:hypothetical protein
VVPYLARGHATANLVKLEGGRLRVRKEDPPWRGNAGWAGDGTVPALSAIPVELGDSPREWRVVGGPAWADGIDRRPRGGAALVRR